MVKVILVNEDNGVYGIRPNAEPELLSEYDWAGWVIEDAEPLTGWGEWQYALRLRANHWPQPSVWLFADGIESVGGQWAIYHRSKAGAPDRHPVGKWFFEPVGYGQGEVYSPGFPTAVAALEAAHNWAAWQALEEEEAALEAEASYGE